MRMTAFLNFVGWLLEDASRFGILGIEFGYLNFFGEADFAEDPDAVVVDIELVPGETVTCADWVGVVVVVPALATGEDGDPPVVAGVVLGFKASLAPEVSGGVDQPCGMKADGDAEEGSPEDHAESTYDVVACRCEGCSEGDLKYAGDDERKVVVLAQPDVDWVLGEVGSIAAQEGSFGVKGTAGEDPAGVSPPGAVVRSVWVAFVVGVLMMNAVGGYPKDRTALKREASAHGDEVLDPLGDFVAAMGEQAVIGYADADVDREEVHDEEDSEIFPGEEEEGSDRSDVEDAHGNGSDPVDATLLVLAAHAEVLLDLLGDFGDGWNCGGEIGRFDRGFFDGGEGTHNLIAVLVFRVLLNC
jgi:hypothetical protein